MTESTFNTNDPPRHPRIGEAAYLRPRDAHLLRAVVRRLVHSSSAEVALAGLGNPTQIVITELAGTRTRALRGLAVSAGRGLGGRGLIERRTLGVDDYGSDATITHDYDNAVLTEGIGSLIACPLIVTNRVRGVLYVGSHSRWSLGERIFASVSHAARTIVAELRIRDEVDRRVAMLANHQPTPEPTTAEGIRQCWAELRQIAAECGDSALSVRIRHAMVQLTPQPAAAVRLTERELDVLALVALGATNREIAARLSIGAESVKSYLSQAMHKFGTTTRLETVSRARHLGLML